MLNYYCFEYHIYVLRKGVEFLMVGSTLRWTSTLDDIRHQFEYFVGLLQFGRLHDVLMFVQEGHVHLMFLGSPVSYDKVVFITCIILWIMLLLNMLSLDLWIRKILGILIRIKTQ